MELRYFLVILVLLVGVGGVDAAFSSFNQTHGETWIKWTWALDAGDYLQPNTLVIYLDGTLEGKYDLLNTPAALVPTEYSLSDLNANEQHNLRLVLLDNSSAPATLIEEKSKSATTSASSSYYFIILGLGVVLFIVSLFVLSARMVLIGLILDVGAVILFGYLATAAYQFMPALSTIAIILGVMSLVPIIYALYMAYQGTQNWSD